jgi:hypothetical protein
MVPIFRAVFHNVLIPDSVFGYNFSNKQLRHALDDVKVRKFLPVLKKKYIV